VKEEHWEQSRHFFQKIIEAEKVFLDLGRDQSGERSKN